MNKLFLSLTLAVSTLAAHAGDYPYLTFETTDGAKVSVEAKSLNISISETTLTAGPQTFTLSNLAKMYFTANSETTGISDSLKPVSEQTVVAVFDLQGRKVQKSDMRNGEAYIVKTDGRTYKLLVK